MAIAERTADGEHVVPGINIEDLSELAEGHGTVVLPFEVCRGVGWGGFAAVPGEKLLHLLHLQRIFASTVLHIQQSQRQDAPVDDLLVQIKRSVD